MRPVSLTRSTPPLSTRSRGGRAQVRLVRALTAVCASRPARQSAAPRGGVHERVFRRRTRVNAEAIIRLAASVGTLGTDLASRACDASRMTAGAGIGRQFRVPEQRGFVVPDSRAAPKPGPRGPTDRRRRAHLPARIVPRCLKRQRTRSRTDAWEAAWLRRRQAQLLAADIGRRTAYDASERGPVWAHHVAIDLLRD
jgi:hypothetical protein